jgi:hypothetical protein
MNARAVNCVAAMLSVALLAVAVPSYATDQAQQVVETVTGPLRDCTSCPTSDAVCWRSLRAGEFRDVLVDAAHPCNPTGVLVDAGATYLIRVVEELAPWKDWWIDSSFEKGWTGVARIVERLARKRAVHPGLPMFVLLAGVDESPAFLVGAGTTFSGSADGRLFFFANDWPHAYANNSGCLRVKVQREQ